MSYGNKLDKLAIVYYRDFSETIVQNCSSFYNAIDWPPFGV